MAAYKSFEDLPVWQRATDLAAEIFELTARPAFKFRGDLVNQIRRAALSISNNIAEGFERGSTNDLINFLYIARGSCGETRSMLRFAPKLDGMATELDGISSVAEHCIDVSRQLYGWIDSLKNTTVKGQRHLNDQTRAQFAKTELMKEFRAKFNPEAESQALAEGRHGEYVSKKLEAIIALKDAANAARVSPDSPTCPDCGSPMVKRHDRNGRAFWGCVNFPRCHGSRPKE